MPDPRRQAMPLITTIPAAISGTSRTKRRAIDSASSFAMGNAREGEFTVLKIYHYMMISPGRLAHVAILVLFAAATRAGTITAHSFAAIANWLRPLFTVLAVGDRRLLLAADAVAVGGHRSGRGFVNHGADRPYGLLKRLGLLHAEDGFRNLVLHPFPHKVEFL